MAITLSNSVKNRVLENPQAQRVIERWENNGQGTMSIQAHGERGFRAKYSDSGHSFFVRADNFDQLLFALKTGGPSAGSFIHLITPEESLVYINNLKQKKAKEKENATQRPAWLTKLLRYLPPYNFENTPPSSP